MESGLASGTSSYSKTHSTTISSELDLDELNKVRTGDTSPNERNKYGKLASDHSKENFSVGSTPAHEHQPSDGLNSNNGSTIESPPTQMMDRASDSTSPDPDRIPPHVFARTKSSVPVEWSVASNESLFSIHTGTMSFTREHFNWMNKSEELGFATDEPLTDIPGSLPPPLPTPAPADKSMELGMKSGNMNQGLGATETVAAETMREVIRENAGNHNDQEQKSAQKVDPRAITLKHSDDSSVKSFAFPILTGSLSVKEKQKKHHSQPQIPKTAAAAEAKVSEAQSEEQTSKSPTPKANKNTCQGRWFSYFSCCSFCS